MIYIENTSIITAKSAGYLENVGTYTIVQEDGSHDSNWITKARQHASDQLAAKMNELKARIKSWLDADGKTSMSCLNQDFK